MLGDHCLEWRSRSNINRHLHSQTSNTLAEAKASLRPCLTLNCRKEFLLTCWQLQLNGSLDEELRPYQSYFGHYEESCTYLQTSYPSLEECTHAQLCQAMQVLQQGTRRSCETTIDTLLPPTSPSPKAARDCIDFIGYAILLINLSGWGADETLREFITRTVASHSMQKDQYRIPLAFNARAFENVAGIKILWTRDLLSHLEVSSDDSTLALFHNVKILQLYERSGLRDIFPDRFLDETYRTLSLMLPVADKASIKWFNLKHRRLGLDIAAGNCRHLRATQRNIQDFDFWRDRLIIAKEAFDLSQPHGLLQFWRDDRNKVQWWTFWIAIIVFVLTVIGVIESALQVYKAYYPS